MTEGPEWIRTGIRKNCQENPHPTKTALGGAPTLMPNPSSLNPAASIPATLKAVPPSKVRGLSLLARDEGPLVRKAKTQYP
jgi:hypothetical protein